MKSKLEKFLILFSRLQRETKNSAKSLEWLSHERPSLCGLCYDLNSCFMEISRFLIKKNKKHIIAPNIFFNKWKDYKENWGSSVAEAAKIEENRIMDELFRDFPEEDGEIPEGSSEIVTTQVVL